MFSLLMVPLVAANFLLLAWLIRTWLHHREALFLVALLPLVMLPYDTGLVALGSTIGQGELLRILSIPRLNWFYLTLPLLIIVAAGIARRAEFPWAQGRWFIGGACALAAGLILAELPRIVGVPTLFPACFKDTVRYVTSVPVSQICTPGQAGVEVAIGLPIGGIVAMLVILAVSVVLWWRRRWPWLAVGTLLSAVMLRLPVAVVGPFGTFLGDFFSMGAMVWTLVHFSHLRRQGTAQESH